MIKEGTFPTSTYMYISWRKDHAPENAWKDASEVDKHRKLIPHM